MKVILGTLFNTLEHMVNHYGMKDRKVSFFFYYLSMQFYSRYCIGCRGELK